MPKNSSQLGLIEISTIAAILIVATIVATVSIYIINKYYSIPGAPAPAAVTTPKKTTAAPTPTPTPAIKDETIDWEVYKNEAFEYEIKYPQGSSAKEWATTIKEQSSGKKNDWLLSEVAIGKNLQLGDSQVFVTVSSRTLEEEKEAIKISVANSQESGILVDGVTSFKYTGAGGEGVSGKIISILVPNPKRTYKLTYTEVNDKTDRTKIFDQIISTFKHIVKKENFLAIDDEPSAKLFCQDLIHPDFKISSFGYYKNSKDEKFADCGVSSINPADPGSIHLIGKFISGMWTVIWSGNGDISQADIAKYGIPKELTK